MLLQVVAERNVLGAAQLWGSKFFPRQVRRTIDVSPWSDNEQSAATRCACNDTESLSMAFDVAINGRVGSNIANVDSTGEERFDL